MAAPKGNTFYELRKTDGKPKTFTPGDLWNLWVEFVIWAKNNPKITHQVNMGKVVQVPIERPLVLSEFYTWVDATYNKVIHQYFDNLQGRYNDYLGVITRIKNNRDSDVTVGALTGIYNSNISVRILGLTDKQELKQEIKAEVKTESKIDLSKLSLEEKKQLLELQKKLKGNDGSGDTES